MSEDIKNAKKEFIGKVEKALDAFNGECKGVVFFSTYEDIENTSSGILTDEQNKDAVVLRTLMSSLTLAHDSDVLVGEEFLNAVTSVLVGVYETSFATHNFNLTLEVLGFIVTFVDYHDLMESLSKQETFSGLKKFFEKSIKGEDYSGEFKKYVTSIRYSRHD